MAIKYHDYIKVDCSIRVFHIPIVSTSICLSSRNTVILPMAITN